MANRKEHDRAGRWVGGLFAAYMARNEPTANAIIETWAGVLAGHFFSHLPDAWEPSSAGPNHRGPMHSPAFLYTAIAAAVREVPHWQEKLRAESQRLSLLAAATDDVVTKILAITGTFLCLAGAGAVPGTLGGYISHLALDARTKNGLPMLIGNGSVSLKPLIDAWHEIA